MTKVIKLGETGSTAPVIIEPSRPGTIKPAGHVEAVAVLADALACGRSVAETVQNARGYVSREAMEVLIGMGYEVDTQNVN